MDAETRANRPAPVEGRRSSGLLWATAAGSFIAGGIVIAVVLPALRTHGSGPSASELARLEARANTRMAAAGEPSSSQPAGPAATDGDKSGAAETEAIQKAQPNSAGQINTNASSAPPMNMVFDDGTNCWSMSPMPMSKTNATGGTTVTGYNFGEDGDGVGTDGRLWAHYSRVWTAPGSTDANGAYGFGNGQNQAGLMGDGMGGMGGGMGVMGRVYDSPRIDSSSRRFPSAALSAYDPSFSNGTVFEANGGPTASTNSSPSQLGTSTLHMTVTPQIQVQTEDLYGSSIGLGREAQRSTRQKALLASLNAVEEGRITINDNEPICYPVGDLVVPIPPGMRSPTKYAAVDGRLLNSLSLAPGQIRLSQIDSKGQCGQGEQYTPIVENPFVGPYAAPLSTFSVDVDTASYANVRRFLDAGRLPPPNAVRVEEMVNYFSYDYPRPTADEPFAVHFELADCPWRSGHQLLRVGLAGREIDREERGLSNLVFLLDVSGSMADENKLPLVKKAMRLLVQQLGENDRVAIVTYASEAALRLESTNGQNKQVILDAIDSLRADGSTNGSGGIQLAYAEAAKHFLPEGNNRVILTTDGDLNVGITDDDQLVKLISEKARSGVFLTVLGFGCDNLKDGKLEKLADRGNGNYFYVDGLREARKVFVEDLTGSLLTIAKDVKIQIEFNPARVAAYRLIGYENRKLRAKDFNDDRKDAGEIGAGHTVTALYELVPVKTADQQKELAASVPKLKYQKVVRPVSMLTEVADSDELATVRLRYKEPDGTKSRLIERVLHNRSTSFSGASPDFQFASAVASFGMILRGSRYAGDATLAAVGEYATPGLANDPNGHRAEFVDLVGKARKLRPEVASSGTPRRNWGPEQATGAPDTPRAGDLPTAWASLQPDGRTEWLRVHFDKAVSIAEVRIRETLNPGAVSKVAATLANGEEMVLWEGQDPTMAAPEDFIVPVEGEVVSKTVTVYLETGRRPGWNEIDAVELVGRDGSRQWASRAEASSTYASSHGPRYNR